MAQTNTESEITDPVTYENVTVLTHTVRIKDGGSLDLINSTVIMLDQGAQLIVYEDSYLNITDPDTLTDDNMSMVYSSSGMSIRALPGSYFFMENTTVEDSSTSIVSPTMELFTGEVRSSHITGPNDLVMIRGIGVTINDTIFTGMNSEHGLVVDVNHTSFGPATMVTNIPSSSVSPGACLTQA